MDEKVYLYYCSICHINFETKKCPKCGRKGTPANPPFERDLSKDPSYLEYVMNKKNSTG